MNIVELLLLVTFVLGLIFSLLTLTFFTLFIFQTQRYKLLNKEKPRRKSRRRKHEKELSKLIQNKNRSLLFLISSMFLALASGGGYVYASYYQSINLSQADKEAVVKAYYLLTDLEKQLESVNNGEAEESSLATNLQNLGGSMSSYANIRASELNKEEGQVILNRYYNIVKNVGINITGQAFEFFEQEQLVDEFLEDISKARVYEKEVFKFYKVDEKNLKKNI